MKEEVQLSPISHDIKKRVAEEEGVGKKRRKTLHYP